jgi:hypothetical protein
VFTAEFTGLCFSTIMEVSYPAAPRFRDVISACIKMRRSSTAVFIDTWDKARADM